MIGTVARWGGRLRGNYSVLQAKIFWCLGRFVRFLSTVEARAHLQRNGPLRVLVDSSVLFHAVTHESPWISTGKAKWGTQEIETGYMARVPVHAEDCDFEVFREIRYLPGIAHLARLGHLKLCTSAELLAEQFRQPIGRFKGYGYYDLNLFSGISFESVDGRQLDLKNPQEKQLARVSACCDSLFRSMLQLLGKRHSLDVYHVFTAEKFQLFAFLHVDLTFQRHLNQHRKHSVISSLRTRVLLPSELGVLIKLRPMSPRLLSYEDASFFVRPDLHLPEQKR